MGKSTNKLRAEKNAINLKIQKEYNILNTQNKKTGSENLENTRAGITLIALVITIIVLLILAGISISMLSRR